MLLLLALAPPFVARACGTGVGAFSMFSGLERYHLDVRLVTAAGGERVELLGLAPHLSRDAKQIILPAAGEAIGADQVDLLSGGLEDIAVLVCRLRRDAKSARVELYRASLDRRKAATEHAEIECAAR